MLYLTLPLCVGTILAQEALVMIGGDYPNGFMDNEVEVWSHDPDCALEIPDTPDFFKGRPGVAFFQDHVYVCGGPRVGTTHTYDWCDVYSLTDQTWSQGPSLKSTNSTQIYMDTVGSSLVAAYMQDESHWDYMSLVVSYLDSKETEWIETFPLDGPACCYIDLVALDDDHVIITIVNYGPFSRKIHIISVETGEVVSFDGPCGNPVIYNNTYTCIGQEVGGNKEIVSLSFADEEFGNPTWTVIGYVPAEILGLDDMQDMVVLDGMLTMLFSRIATVAYLQEGEWKLGEFDIPRTQPAAFVMPCNP